MVMSSEIAGAIEEDENMFDHDIKDVKSTTTSVENLSNIKTVDLTLSQRMLCACTGSLLTSLVVTPFDVVRIRLQQQELLYPVQTRDVTCCRKVFWELPTDKMMGSLKGNFCQPNSCFNEGARITGTFQGLTKIASDEGICTLYRGLSLTLIMAIPSNVVYFSGYEFLRDSSPLKENFPVINPLLCGSIARVLAATSVAPLELIKTRTQAVPTGTNGSSNDIFKMVVKNSLSEIKERGVFTIFKGLGLTLWRDVPFSGIYWSTYEYIMHVLRNQSWINESNTYLTTDASLFLRSFIGGSLAGITAAVFTNPFDVGKTRMQLSLEDNKNMGTLSKHLKNENTIFKFISEIYKNEGFAALYVGLLPRCMKIAPACAIMISSYEMTKKFFKDKSI
jgi:solute carrier family 25 protein 39/40